MLIVAAALSGIAAITLVVIDATSSSGDATVSAPVSLPGADASVQPCVRDQECTLPETCIFGNVNSPSEHGVACAPICLGKNSDREVACNPTTGNYDR